MTIQKALMGALAALFVAGIGMTWSKDSIAQTPTIEALRYDYVSTGGARGNNLAPGERVDTYLVIPGNNYFLTDLIFSNLDGTATCGRVGKVKRDDSTVWRTSRIGVPAEGSVVIQFAAPTRFLGGESVAVQNCSDGGGDLNWTFQGVNTVPNLD